MKNQKGQKKKGFTLIELIIVVAIIGIIAAIAIPKFGSAQMDAKISADKSNAKIIADAATLGISEGKVADTTGDNPVAIGSTLSGYINSVPKAQAVAGDFTIKIKNGIVTIYSSSKEVYPNLDATYAK